MARDRKDLDANEILYGLNPAFETIRARRRTIFRAFLLEDFDKRPRLAKLARLLEKAGVDPQAVDKHFLYQRSGTKQHQGVALEVSPYPYEVEANLLRLKRLLLLDNLEDPQNTGAIMRSADVFGFHGILLPTKGVPPIYPSMVKASAGAVEHLLVSRRRTAVASMRVAQEAGFKVASLDARGDTPIGDFSPPEEPLLLVIGGEDKSVGRYILDQSDWVLSLPSSGRVNSLNASVAAAIAMHAIAAALAASPAANPASTGASEENSPKNDGISL